MTQPLTEVLGDLADLVGRIGPDQDSLPTPCPEFDVAGLRRHVLGWLPVFATALADPDGTSRPDPEAYCPPADAQAAAEEVRRSTATVATALDRGVAQRPVNFLSGTLPGGAVVSMLTAEALTHGWDLARATGLPWDPPAPACETALAALGGMLQPEHRGPGKPFGVEVPVPDDAPALDRLLGFSGRDPSWHRTGS